MGNNFRIVQELRAADCEESVALSRRRRSPEKKDIWLENGNLRMRKERLENCISKRVTPMIKSADGRKPATWRGGAQILKKEEGFQDVGPL